jgi:hypothetical protein
MDKDSLNLVAGILKRAYKAPLNIPRNVPQKEVYSYLCGYYQSAINTALNIIEEGWNEPEL